MSEAAEARRARPGRLAQSPWLWGLLGLAVSAVLMWLAMRNINFDVFFSTLEHADAAEMALAALLVAAPWAVLGLRWRVVARRMGPPGALRMASLVFLGAAVNNSLPGRLGDVARAVCLARDTRRSAAEALGTMVVDRIADIIFFTACLGLTYTVFPHQRWLVWVAAASVVAVVAMIAIVAAVVAYARRPHASRHRWGAVVTRALGRLSDGLTSLRSPRDVALVVLFTALAWGALSLGNLFGVRALGIHLSLVQAVFLTTVISLGTALPSLPGFVGTYHWVASTVLQGFGVPPTQVFAAAVVLHALGFLLTTLIGAPIMLREGITGSGLRSRARSVAAPGASALAAPQDPRGDADDGHPRVDVPDGDRPCAQHGVVADPEPRQDH